MKTILLALKAERPEKGFTLLEMLIILIIISILALLLLPTLEGLINGAKVNIAVSQLSQWFKQTRMDGTGEGKDQSTLCMKQDVGKPVQLAKVYGEKYCEIASYPITLPKGVEIDRNNTTFRSQPSWAGNGGSIYRVTWEDTKAGDGGSAGQHGKIVLRAGSKLVCIVDGGKNPDGPGFDNSGDYDIRKGNSCLRK